MTIRAHRGRRFAFGPRPGRSFRKLTGPETGSRARGPEMTGSLHAPEPSAPTGARLQSKVDCVLRPAMARLSGSPFAEEKKT
jgi:hypothetical protein